MLGRNGGWTFCDKFHRREARIIDFFYDFSVVGILFFARDRDLSRYIYILQDICINIFFFFSY